MPGRCGPAAVRTGAGTRPARRGGGYAPTVTTCSPSAALDRLRQAAADGVLDGIYERHGVRLLGAFGSAVGRDRHERAADLDVAVSFCGEPAVVGLLDELVQLTGCDVIDLVVIDGVPPLLRAEALTGVPLFETERGGFATAQMAALAERRDTAWLRQLDLDALAA